MDMVKRLLDSVVDVCDVRGRRQRREREAQRLFVLAEATKHEQLHDLLESVLNRVQDGQKGTTEALVEVAKGVQENAKAFSRWMGLFEQHQGEGYSHTVRPLQEMEEHQERERERLKALGYPVDEPADAQLAAMQSLMAEALSAPYPQDRA